MMPVPARSELDCFDFFCDCAVRLTVLLMVVEMRDEKLQSVHQQATALHMAAQGGHLASVDALLAAGAHVDARMTLGVSPLGVAAEKGECVGVVHSAGGSATVFGRERPAAVWVY
jgi:ankyrin repeat protein